uniref:Uncharacterized protein n=1 Tax=Acrobeloides nanus TaxID=290746 RepID=A0A914BZM6_9BILA
MDTKRADYNSIINVLKEFSQVSGEKLKVPFYNVERSIRYIEMLHILNYVQASKVVKTLYFIDADYDSFFLFNDIGLTTEYQLTFYYIDSLNPLNNINYKENAKVVKRLIEMLGKYENKELHRFSIKYYLSDSIEQCNRLIEIYMNAKDPSYLPVLDFGINFLFLIYKDLAGIDTADYLQEYVNKKKFSYTVERDYEIKERYEIKTVEGHRLQIIFGSFPDKLNFVPIRMQLIPKDDSPLTGDVHELISKDDSTIKNQICWLRQERSQHQFAQNDGVMVVMAWVMVVMVMVAVVIGVIILTIGVNDGTNRDDMQSLLFDFNL